MKKIFAIAGLLLFASCQEDDSTQPVYNVHEDVYVSQMIENNGGTVTHTYTYDGNLLLTDTDTQGYERQYSYVNDLLVQEDVYLNGELDEYTIFSYTFDKKLAQSIHITSNGDGTWYGFKNRFTYKNDGTLTIAQFEGDEEGQYTPVASGTLTYTNGNITSYTLTPHDEDEDDDLEPTPVVTAITYTGGKAPFKNIFGYEAMCLAQLQGGPNTIASVTIGEGEGSTTVNYTYQEDVNGYPAQESRDNGINRQFTY